MNPLRSRPIRTVLLTLLGFALVFAVAAVAAPLWPACEDQQTRLPCEDLSVQTMAGYLTIALGLLTIIFGPIAGSLIDLYLHGAKWETPRGTENIITNMPVLIGAVYLVSGLLIVATA
ncbi:MAG: hypothetical protein QNJ71_07565 [Acidimicrobiia bacterium]|nr:hypothetical protein [Acidimicrobiia bacterium]